jgi:peptidyl-dipeptidase A
MADRTAARLVEAWTERLAPATRERSEAWWRVNVAATPEHAARYRAALLALEDAARDAEGFARIGRALEEGVVEPRRRRALEVLRSTLLPFQGPADARREMAELVTRVQERYANVRGTVGGRPVSDLEVASTLEREDDPARRREAWEASKEVGAAVAPDVRRLAALRNEVARALGHDDHRAMELARQETDAAWLDAFLRRMDEGTAAPFAAWKSRLDERLAARFATTPEGLRPWHHGDAFFQEAPAEAGEPGLARGARPIDPLALARRTFSTLGFDVEGVLARSDLEPRAGKCQHAFCSHVDREGDVRVLANVAPTERSASTMLHELGHAVYDEGIDRALPWALRTPPHTASTEAVAMLFGALVHDADWLASVPGLDAETARAAGAAGARRTSARLLVFTRWVLVMTEFERALYADPEGDLDTLWWDLVERHQRVRRPDGRAAPDWAAKIHVATAPVYYHSYLVGEAIASQMRAALRAATGGGLAESPAAGAWLRERWFAPGSSSRWDAHLEAATGTPLDPAHLLAETREPTAAARG